MKKLLLSLTLCFTVFTMQAQDLIKNIPASATAVVTIKGKNVTDLLSIKEFENSRVGQEILKELTRNSKGELTSLNDLGIDFSSNLYYFLESEKGLLSNYFVAPLNNKSSIDKLMTINERDSERIKTDGTLTYFQSEYDGTITAWNNEVFVVLFSESTNSNYGYDVSGSIEVSEGVVEATEVEDVVVESVEEDAVNAAMDAVEGVKDAAKDASEVEETVIIETEYPEEVVKENTNDYYKKREERYAKERAEREAKRIAKNKKISQLNLKKAKAFINGAHRSNNILKNKSYTSSLGKQGFEAHAWVGNFMNIYQEALFNNAYNAPFNLYSMYNIEELYRGTTISSTLDVNKENVVLNIDYTMSDVMAQHTKAMYNGKMNSDFFKYFNQEKMIGYMSVNMSTEGLLTEYPKLMKSMFTNAGDNEMATMVPLGADLLSVFLDEKAISELVRGDMLFVVNDITKKQVTYTTYDYDKDYNRIPIEKTKEETVPDFIFMATSNGESIFNRLMNIVVKEKEATLDNGVYTFNTPKSMPINIHAMHKNGVLFFATSKDQLLAVKNGTYIGNASGKLKKNIRKNTSAFYINGKKIISQIPVEELPREFKNKISYLTSNTEDMFLTSSKLKGNVSKSKIILNTPKDGHKNGLAYFINFIDAFMD